MQSERFFKIKNPYENVTELLSNQENHYKTNLHTHSTYSDANETMTAVIEGFYDCDFDILAFAEHGIHGKEWDKEPSIVPLYLFQNLWHGKRAHPSTEEYRKIQSGTYKTEKGLRTKKRGMMCVPDAIEANMLTLVKNHVNGYFTDDSLEGICGKENDYETPIAAIERSGGLSHINHPTDWLQAIKYPDCAKKKENIDFFADILRRYKSCLGIEVLNMYDIPNFCDRILWDELLGTLVPEGERSVLGFANSDAHQADQADTAFMDFILPDCSLDSLRSAMEKGSFFAVARYAKGELGENFKGEGPYPVVTEITADEEKQTIKIKGENCSCIEWITDGKIIHSDKSEHDGELSSLISLREAQDSITCYIRAQLKGRGGITMTQAIILDDGNIARYKRPLLEQKELGISEKLRKKFSDSRLGVITERFILKK